MSLRKVALFIHIEGGRDHPKIRFYFSNKTEYPPYNFWPLMVAGADPLLLMAKHWGPSMMLSFIG